MNNEDIKKVVKVLKIRCKNALKDNNEAIDKINEHIEKLAKEWCSEVKYCEENKIKLVYNSKDKSYSNLLCNFGEKNGKWQTLQSMRNVENSALIKLS